MAISDRMRQKNELYYEHYREEGDSVGRRLHAADRAKTIASLCSSLRHRSIIEIGAGDGSVLQGLAELNFGEELHALEITASGIEVIKGKNIPGLVECTLFDGYSIPHDDAAFDLAVLCHVLEHVEHPRRLLREAGRVAKHVYVEVPLELTMRLSPDNAFERFGHINYYSAKTIRSLIQTSGLDVLGQVVTTPSKSVYMYEKGKKGLANYYLKKCLLKIVPGLATQIFTYHSALSCRRQESPV